MKLDRYSKMFSPRIAITEKFDDIRVLCDKRFNLGFFMA